MERRSFTFEQLEGRALFSVVAPMDTTPMTAISPPAISQAATTTVAVFPGKFNVAGTYSHPIGPIGNPDTGSQYHFVGVGKTRLLGNFRLTGNIQLPGFVAMGRAMGTLVIRAARGNIYLSVTGPLQPPGSLPTSLTFEVYRGTGAYAHPSGMGTIGLSASASTQKFVFRFHPKK